MGAMRHQRTAERARENRERERERGREREREEEERETRGLYGRTIKERE